MARTEVKADAEVAKVDKPIGGNVEDELIGRMVDQAREQGLDLVGEGGLLQQLTKRVLESALEGDPHRPFHWPSSTSLPERTAACSPPKRSP
jgi:putative transposase